MKSLKGALSHITLTGIFILSLFLFARQAFAEESLSLEEAPTFASETAAEAVSTPAPAANDDEPNDGTVEVIYAPELLAPYKERQGNWGFVFGANYSEFYPDKFRSKIDNLTYDQLYDSYPMDMIQLDGGIKYNTALGSLGVGFSGGYASVSGTAKINGNRVGGPRDMKVIKIGLTGTYTLDTLFSEPYVAPYISGQIFKMDWEENDKINALSKSGSTGMAFGVAAGLLIQLNWLDPDSALFAQNTSGLNNTFLDLFVNQYNTSDTEADPNFETNMNVGGGIKLEF